MSYHVGSLSTSYGFCGDLPDHGSHRAVPRKSSWHELQGREIARKSEVSSACPLRFRSTVFASLHSLRCTCEGDSFDDIAWRLLLDAAGSGIQLALPGNLLADDAPVAASPFSKDPGSLPCWIHSDKHLLSPTTRQCFGEGLSGLLLPSWRTSRSFF